MLLYLGAWFHKYLDTGFLLRQKLGEARGVMGQLKLFWKHVRCTSYTLETTGLRSSHLCKASLHHADHGSDR